MNGILKHVVHKVRRGLDEVIDGLQHLEVFSLLLMENIELIFVLIELHPIYSLLELISLIFNHFLSFLDFFLLFLQLFNFFVNLFLHHLE